MWNFYNGVWTSLCGGDRSENIRDGFSEFDDMEIIGDLSESGRLLYKGGSNVTKLVLVVCFTWRRGAVVRHPSTDLDVLGSILANSSYYFVIVILRRFCNMIMMYLLCVNSFVLFYISMFLYVTVNCCIRFRFFVSLLLISTVYF